MGGGELFISRRRRQTRLRCDWSSEVGAYDLDTRAGEEAVDEAIAESTDMIKERGMGAMGPLMGVVMQKLGGSADGKTVSEALRRKLSELDD